VPPLVLRLSQTRWVIKVTLRSKKGFEIGAAESPEVLDPSERTLMEHCCRDTPEGSSESLKCFKGVLVKVFKLLNRHVD
jgi:hypothetical protein